MKQFPWRSQPTGPNLEHGKKVVLPGPLILLFLQFAALIAIQINVLAQSSQGEVKLVVGISHTTGTGKDALERRLRPLTRVLLLSD